MKIRGHDVLISRHSFLPGAGRTVFPDGEPEQRSTPVS
jgi:hypothetical protein